MTITMVHLPKDTINLNVWQTRGVYELNIPRLFVSVASISSVIKSDKYVRLQILANLNDFLLD